MTDLQLYAWAATVLLAFGAGHLSGARVPSKHATFVERRKNTRNAVVWAYKSRDFIRQTVTDEAMARMGRGEK